MLAAIPPEVLGLAVAALVVGGVVVLILVVVKFATSDSEQAGKSEAQLDSLKKKEKADAKVAEVEAGPLPLGRRLVARLRAWARGKLG